MSNRQFDALRVFDGEDDEHDVERLQVKIALQMMNGIDQMAIDPEMLGNGPADDVIVIVGHEFCLYFLEMVPSGSVLFCKARTGPIRNLRS